MTWRVIAVSLGALFGLVLSVPAQANAQRLTSASAEAKVRAAVKASARGATIQRITCSKPKRGTVRCRVAYATRRGRCTDSSVRVRRGKRKLVVRGLRAKCVASKPVAPPPTGAGQPPEPPPPAPSGQAPVDPQAGEEPRDDAPRRQVIVNSDGGLSIYTWSRVHTDCYADYGSAPYTVYDAIYGYIAEVYCNFDMIDNYSSLRTGRGTTYYYYGQDGGWYEYKMCYPGARDLADAITGDGINCDYLPLRRVT